MRRTFQIGLGLLYLAVVCLSLSIYVKPGAAVFYRKSQIQTSELIREGNAYTYQFKFIKPIYNPETILVLEDQKVLGLSPFGYTKPLAPGSYAIKDTASDQITVLFSPTDFTDPATSGHVYSVYIRPYWISRETGGIGFFILIPGLLAVWGSLLINAKNRRALFNSFLGIGRCWKDVNGQLTKNIQSFITPRYPYIKQSILNIILVVYFYILMEWVFLVTMPSFMNIFNTGQKISIFLETGLAATLLALFVFPVLILFDAVLAPAFPTIYKYIYHIPEAFLLSCLCLIVIDNITYSGFSFGIVSSQHLVRAIYTLLFVCYFVFIFWKITTSNTALRSSRLKTCAAAVLVCSAGILAAFGYAPINKLAAQRMDTLDSSKKPNIILLGTDGLNADHMSAYGYSRDTTPFIDVLKETSLFSENNFSNAYSSMGSETSMLTGKLPLATRVIYSPDTLKGNDIYQHLPGLLKQAGYRTVSLGVPYYVDVNTINFQNAFDAVNCQENNTSNPYYFLSGWGFDDEMYLLNTITMRIVVRLGHIFFIKDMQNPYAQVTQPFSDEITDQERMDCLRAYLDEANQTGQPLFAHIHLMATHGPKFHPSVQVFSKGKNQDQDWMADFYDDSILNFDQEVESLVQYLEDHDQYENTILILYTDHGEQYYLARLPLLIHFPNDRFARVISDNTQYLDIAPTILDYLGMRKPIWMTGNSLLDKLDSKRLILGAITDKVKNFSDKFYIPIDIVKPPFFQFSHITVIQCQKWYLIDLEEASVMVKNVENYVGPCPEEVLDSQQTILSKVGNLLIQLGFHLPDTWSVQ